MSISIFIQDSETDCENICTLKGSDQEKEKRIIKQDS